MDEPVSIVVRPPCAALSKTELLFDLNGGTGEASITAEPGCEWALSKESASAAGLPDLPFWLHVSWSYTMGRSATLQYRADPSTYGRSTTVVAGDHPITISERRTARTFDDVPPSSDFFDAINLMRQRHITLGCSATPALFCPEQATTRGQAAALIIRALFPDGNFSFSPQPYFIDVSASHPLFPYIQKLREMNITAGCSAVEFCPDRVLTRAQAAVFLVRAKFGTGAFSYTAAPWFTDVQPSNPAFIYVQKLFDLGITHGCDAGLYCPDSDTARQQMAVLLMRGLFDQAVP